MKPSESLDRLPNNNNAKTFCVVCEKECSSAHSCGSCDKDVHAVCEISNEADEGSAAHVSLQAQGAEMLKNSGAKFLLAKIGDNVRIRIPDVDRGRGDPRSVLAVVTNVEDAFYKLGSEHDVLKQLYSRTNFSILHEKLLTLELTGNQGYTPCKLRC
ncbi:hypothetical protein ILUMI_23558 [Ignelater luminosus]|uniref:SCAN domain-containing protein n=1 Tax=Ignelater luminosus TaxID=2038154 RepID=A0A8K0FZJ1_IGNLU|nr:hypothetical protein ILUMI_23558 [Ignelater luminosus]